MQEGSSDELSETESGLPDAVAIAQYIIQNYPYSSKIIEVCAGNYLQIAFEIKKSLPRTKVIVTDITPDFIDFVEENAPSLTAIVDNIMEPNKELYRGASLIYAIRPPVELQPLIAQLAEEVGADLIFRTLSDEYPPLVKSKQKLLFNTSKALLHIYKW
ncbi:MAG: UPF0146 family protein [Candidatus Hodarchaeota archaeon]